MENRDSFKNAQNYFETWAPERQRILKELRTIRDEIQQQARIHSIGNITYSIFGIIGGILGIAGIAMAPVTLGTSLILTATGIATGVTSGVAGVTHGIVKIGIVKKQCNHAKASLEKHDTTCKEMKRLVTLLRQDIDTIMKDSNTLEISHVGEGVRRAGSTAVLGKDIFNLVTTSIAVDVYRITGNADEVARVLSLGAALDDIVPSALKDVSKGVTKLSTEALSAMAAIGLIIDLGSLIWNAVDLSKIQQGQLCAEAEKFQKVIEQMQHEYDVLNECFSCQK
ncbi:apolipoprotein L3-like [Saccostrea echinata]|uniref:apolipoprotein L3-like n=1 Tax=Saccostrea echinata TaxID=191078 RepID=UPI002A808BB3|nr:apolipoprotein L3-like [Saccostrea echinata]